jgi:hypothetical protein
MVAMFHSHTWFFPEGLAGSVVMILPAIILFFFSQRIFTQGAVISGISGWPVIWGVELAPTLGIVSTRCFHDF